MVTVALFIWINGVFQTPVYFVDLTTCVRGMEQFTEAAANKNSFDTVHSMCVEGVVPVARF